MAPVRESFSRYRARRDDARERKRIVHELNYPELEKLSSRFFFLSKELTRLEKSRNAEEGSGTKRFRERLETESNALWRSDRARLFLYTTKKLVRFAERNIEPDFPESHWKHHFLNLGFLKDHVSKLPDREKSFVARSLREAVVDDLSKLQDKTLRARLSGMRASSLESHIHDLDRLQETVHALRETALTLPTHESQRTEKFLEGVTKAFATIASDLKSFVEKHGEPSSESAESD